MTPVSEERLQQVHPKLSTKVHTLACMLMEEGIEIEVVQALRSWNQQDTLYQQGRTKPGKIVTRCPAGHSWHNFGLAVDVAPFENNLPDWDATHPDWKRMEEIAKSLGLVCGSDFRTFPDNPHLQLTFQYPVNPTDEIRYLFRQGGVNAVWDSLRM